MKRNAIIRIVLYSIAILVLLGILGSILAFDQYAFFPDNSTIGWKEAPVSVSGEICSSTFSPDDIHSIDIDWAAGNITIRPDAKATQITVAEPAMANAKHQMVCKVSSGTLKIEFCEENLNWIGVNHNDSKDLAITVPLGWVCRELEFDVAAANVTIYNATIENVDFDGASGICTFTDCTVNKMEVDTASGDLQFTGSLDSLEYDAMSANCQLALNNHPRNIEVSTMSGDLQLVLPEDCGFTLGMDALSEDFTTDFQTTITNGHHVHGDGSCRINVEAMSGDVAIHKNTAQHNEHH